MSDVFTRHLKFCTNNLGADVTLMLTFNNKDIKGLYHDKFPICWKVANFAAEGPYSMRVKFQSQLAFVKSQISSFSHTIVDTSTYKLLNVGDKTTLTKDARGVFHFSEAVDGEHGHLQVVNGCPSVEDISIGFVEPNSDEGPTPVLYFHSIDNGSLLEAQFTPVLRAYVTTQYQETQIIRDEVDTPVIWERDLTKLAKDTTWVLARDEQTGWYKITPV
ncbi:hypothetical protein BS17DRAFT_820308 [Gyrodon lividus]|nr:hypothetical protein BS17DRAFT_820308 [Gyrodon lividus]